MDVRLVSLLLALLDVALALKTHPFVQTTSGAVRGKKITVLGKELDRYVGIPFATPPIGDLRFRKPEPVTPWEGLYEATEKPPPCVQYNLLKSPVIPDNDDVSEDCLYLNVWVPHRDKTDTTLRAIMVWIHGGAFHMGESSSDIYDGSILAAYGDVIVASMNYRLGVFGFLNAETDEAPGNMGLLDQVLALQWIKDNSKAFGGDLGRITIFGESAGSMSVGLHILSPLSRGLFTRAIMESGTPYHSPMGGENSCTGPVKGEKLAKAVGCSNNKQSLTSHQHEVISCLKAKDPKLLAKAETTIFGFSFRFLPSYGDEFMPHAPIAVLQEGKFDQTNVMIGFNYNEGALFLLLRGDRAFIKDSPPKLSVREGRKYIASFFDLTNSSSIADVYIPKDEESQNIAQGVLNAIGDYAFVCPTVLFNKCLTQAGSTVYFYRFDHHPSTSWFKSWVINTHFEEVQYVFGLPLKSSSRYTKEEEELSRSMMDKWVAFAKEGVPLVSKNEPWPKYNLEEYPFLRILTQESVVDKWPNEDHCKFWDEHFYKG